MKTLAALLTVSLGALFAAAQAQDSSREPGFETPRFAPTNYSPYDARYSTEPGFETPRFAPADYSPYDARYSTPPTYPGVDWTALAPPHPQPRVAFPAVIRMPLDPSPPRR